MSDQTHDDATQRQRRFAPKRRGGCRTCSARHVACDQTKPVCTACRRSSRQCSYDPIPRDRTKKPLKVVFFDPSRGTKERLPRSVSLNNPDGRALTYFMDVAGPQLGGMFETKSWNRIIYQVARSFAPLRKAIAALATLWESTVADSTASLHSAEDLKVKALGYYASAVSEAREVSKHDSSIRELLMCNILFVCLENLQQNHESVVGQVSSGLFLFCNWQKSLYSPITTMQDPNIDDISLHLMRTYQRLLAQALTFFDVNMLTEDMFTPQLLLPITSIPTRFSSIENCRDTFYDIVSAMLQQIASINLEADSKNFEISTCNRPMMSLRKDILDQFVRVFLDLKSRSQDVEEKDKIALMVIEMLFRAFRIYHEAETGASEMAFDQYESEFRKIVDLGDIVVHFKEAHCTPCMDMECLPPLHVVGRWCRDPTLRRRAISLLRQANTQEGVWSSGMLARFDEAVMEIEESGCPFVTCAADIPESQRLTNHRRTIRSVLRESHLMFFQGGRPPAVEARIVECTIQH